jgi:multiple sugar transport system substrate-binding protein
MKCTRILTILILLTMVAPMVGCGQAVTPGPQPRQTQAQTVESTAMPVSVTMLGWENIPGEPENAKDCGVNYETVPWGDYLAKLSDRTAAGTLPDIIMVDITQFMGLVEQKVVAPLSSSVVSGGEFLPSLTKAFTYNGVSYAIPRAFWVLALFYNRDLFDKYGLSYPTDDWTWGDLEKAAEYIAKGTGKRGLFTPSYSYAFSAFIFQNGGRIMAEDFLDTYVDRDEAFQAAEFYVGLRQRGLAAIPEDVGQVSSEQAFRNWDVAMALEGHWMAKSLADKPPEFGYSAVQPPAGPRGEGNTLFAQAYAVSAYSKNPQEALKAIGCLTSEKIQSRILESGWSLPARASLGGHPYLQEHPIENTLFMGASFASPFNWGPRHAYVDERFQQALEETYKGADLKTSFFKAAEDIRGMIKQQDQ